MSKEQKRLAAVFLCIIGIVGTLMAMKDRQAAAQAQTETASAAVATEAPAAKK